MISVKTIKHLYINISLALTYLMFPCLLVEELISMFGFRIEYGQLIIFFNLVLIVVFNDNYYLPNTVLHVIYIYLILSFYTLFITVVNGSVGSVVYFMRSYFKNILLFILFLLILHNRIIPIGKVIKCQILLAFIASVSSILLLILLYTGNLNIKTVSVAGSYGDYGFKSAGFLGYINYSRLYFSAGHLPRMQWFYTEPARFAQFLMLPLFASYYYSRRNSIYKYIFVIILFAFISTFSVAGMGGAMGAFLTYRLLSKRKNKIVNYVSNGVLSILFLLFYYYLTSMPYYSFVIPVTKGGAIEGKIDAAQTLSQMVFKEPLGSVPLYSQAEPQNSFAILQIFAISGVFGGILIVVLLSIIVRSLLAGVSSEKSIKYIFMGGLAYFIALSWFGSYFQIYYFFVLALMLSLYAKDVSKRRLMNISTRRFA